jgi:hypothetical protein
MITEFESFSTIVSSTGKRTQQLVGPSYEIRLNLSYSVKQTRLNNSIKGALKSSIII